jgi:hypothetical protein
MWFVPPGFNSGLSAPAEYSPPVEAVAQKLSLGRSNCPARLSRFADGPERLDLREQELLLPPSLRDWLPADHLAWCVLDVVEELDLDAFLADYRQDGWVARC